MKNTKKLKEWFLRVSYYYSVNDDESPDHDTMDNIEGIIEDSLLREYNEKGHSFRRGMGYKSIDLYFIYNRERDANAGIRKIIKTFSKIDVPLTELGLDCEVFPFYTSYPK
jgi:hypothetical protein